VTGLAIAVGLLIAFLSGVRSAEAIADIYFVLGGLLAFVGFLDVQNTKLRPIDHTYQLSRSAGSMSLDERNQNDIRELHQSYSGLMLFAISGLLTIMCGIAIYKIFG